MVVVFQFEIAQYKNEKAWYNIQLKQETMVELLSDSSWYRLLIPAEHLEAKDFNRIRSWHEIAVALLKKYCERYYSFKKNEYEAPNLEYYDVKPEEDNFIDEYKATVDASKTEWIEFLEEMANKLGAEKKGTAEFKIDGNGKKFGNLKLFDFSSHLYKPLIYFKNNEVLKISPVAMNEGEYDFVEDLKKHFLSNKELFKKKEIYLLRNQSKKGVAFFLAGNFYPDFILWINFGDKQFISFIDPKGLRQIHGFDDPKISFHKEIKKIEANLSDPNIVLNSFIVSNTPYKDIKWWIKGDDPEKEFSNNHVLFQKDAKDKYISQMIHAISI